MLKREIIVNMEILTLLFGLSSVIPVATIANVSKTSFFGSVYATTLMPIQGAEVTASGTNGFGTASTNASGQYNITHGLYGGNYTVMASAPGYVDAQIIDVHVTPGLETTNVNFVLGVSGSISGKITETGTGVPLASVTVKAVNATGSGIVGPTATTDVNGDYNIITNLPTGMYNVTVQYAVGHLSKTKPSISVVAGIETTGVNLSLDRSATIAGTVTDSFLHTPLSGIFVDARATAFSRWGDITNSTGQYSINTNLGTGTYNVSTPFPTGYVPNTVTNVAVTAGQTVTVNIALDPSGIISGQVTNTVTHQPTPDATVDVYSTLGSYFGFAITNATGHYAITSGLGNGTYTVNAFVTGGFGTYPTPVNVIEGKETSNINIQITVIPPPSSGIITGTVTNSSGSPIEFADVVADGPMGHGEIFTDVNGFYNISNGLGTGMYTVNVSALGYYLESKTSISVTVNMTTIVDFQLFPIPSGSIEGTVQSTAPAVPEFASQTIILIVIASTSIALVVAKLCAARVKRKES